MLVLTHINWFELWRMDESSSNLAALLHKLCTGLSSDPGIIPILNYLIKQLWFLLVKTNMFGNVCFMVIWIKTAFTPFFMNNIQDYFKDLVKKFKRGTGILIFILHHPKLFKEYHVFVLGSFSVYLLELE